MLVRILFSIVVAAAAATTATASSVSVVQVLEHSSTSNNNNNGHPDVPRRRNLVAKKTPRPAPTPAPTFPTGFAPHPAAPYPDLGYPDVTIQNDTPYDTKYDPTIDPYKTAAYILYGFCKDARNYISQSIATGQKFTGTYRGGCLVRSIGRISLTRPEDEGGNLDCASYESSGTGYAKFFIIMYDGRCCVTSSEAQSKECPWMKERN